MAIVSTLEVVEIKSGQKIVINKFDFDSKLHKSVSKGHENAPRATNVGVVGAKVTKKVPIAKKKKATKK